LRGLAAMPPQKFIALTGFCFFAFLNAHHANAQKGPLDSHEVALDELTRALTYHTPGNKKSKANIKKAQEMLTESNKFSIKRLARKSAPRSGDMGKLDDPNLGYQGEEKWWLSENSFRKKLNDEEQKILEKWLHAKRLYDWAGEKERELVQGPLYGQFDKDTIKGKIRRTNRAYVMFLKENADKLFEDALPLLEKYDKS
jgi:hypothetical protein